MLLLSLISLQTKPEEPAFYKSLVGEWIGTLEYKDYSDGSRVRLPTILRVSAAKDRHGLRFRYIFDDGPTKVVQDVSFYVWDPVPKKLTVTSDDDKEVSYYTATSLTLNALGLGSQELVGKVTENGKAVDIRETLRIKPSSFELLRESRLPGAGFEFRHIYKFQRVEQPQ